MAAKPARNVYGFERIFRAKGAAPSDSNDKYYKKFLCNLGMTEEPPQDADAALLRRYVARVHVNAQWYNRQIRAEKTLQCIVFVVGVALLLVVPPLVYFAPVLFGKIAPTGVRLDELGAQLPVFLAGFYAAHRAVSSWFNERKFIGTYWEARTKLMNEIYTIETEWHSRDKLSKEDGSFLPDFKSAIQAGISSARAIVQEERQKFFAHYTFRDLNLPTLLSNAVSGAETTMSAFESAAGKRLRKEAEARVTPQELLARILELRANADRLARRREDLGRALAAAKKDRDAQSEGSDARVSANATVKKLQEALGETEADEVINKTNLAACGRTAFVQP